MERVLFAPRALPPLRPDVSHDVAAYDHWIRRREAQRSGRPMPNRWRGKRSARVLHLVLPVARDPASAVAKTLESIAAQSVRSWELGIVASSDRVPELVALVRRVMPRNRRRRVRVLGDASEALADQAWSGLRSRRGVPMALVFPGDLWTPDAVALMGDGLSPTSVVYADDDVLTGNGTFALPRLKPDYSPDFLLSTGYIGAPLAMGNAVADELLPPLAEERADLEHEFALAACASAESVIHIPEVLCHRMTVPTGPSGPTSGAKVVQLALERRGDPGEVRAGPVDGTYSVSRPTSSADMVSIVIPFRDEPRLLRTCIDSVTATTRGDRTEFVLVDNGSTDPETLTLLGRLEGRDDVTVVADPRPFNWAELNNVGADSASGNVLLFLNNDIEALHPGWLRALAGHALRDDVGAVGARLLYPDRRLQHCGVVVGLIGAAGHPLLGLEAGSGGYLNMARATRECTAVTGACLASRREVFERLDGFDESLGVDLNDVDYCLRGLGAGLRTVFEPAVELLHHESPSRGTAGGAGDIVKFIARWKEYIAAGDPFLNVHLTRSDVSCALATSDERERWNQWYSDLVAP